MFNPPMTKEEAARYRYGQWVGWPHGFAYNQSRCAYEVGDAGFRHQCNRKPGHGPDGLYCKQHARMVGGKETES